MELISLKDVSVKYKNGVNAIQNVTTSIKKGEFVFIVGQSGSGKSTFIKLLYREVKPDKGQVYLSGLNVANLRNNKVYKIRRKLGVVFQDYRLLEKKTVYENVAFALEIVNTPKKEIYNKVLTALELVGLKGKTRSYPTELSGGEQQRVAIARAIVNNPKVLICDELTGNLDPKHSKEIMKILERINRETETTIIVATHNKEIVDKMKKRVIAIKNGCIVSDQEKGGYYESD